MSNNLTLSSATFDASSQKFGSAAMSGGNGQTAATGATGYPLTIEAWVKLPSNPGANQVAVGAANANGNFWIGCNPQGRAAASYNGTSVSLISTVPLYDGNWHHVALVLTAGGGSLYVDGTLAASNSTATSGLPTGLSVRTFLPQYSGYDWSGEVDEVAVWKVAKYASNFTLPISAYAGNESGLANLYHLDGNGADSAGSAPLAATYTLTGPSSGTVSQASSAFTVMASGVTSSAIVITPSDGGVGGTFSPNTVLLASGTNSSGTFAYTAVSAGSKTISTTNNGSLTNPAALRYSAVAAPSGTTIAPNSVGIVYSPGTWLVGSTSAKTINSGAYFRTIFTGSQIGLTFDTSANSTPLPQLYYRIDGVNWTQVTLAPSLTLTMPAPTSAWPHHLLEMVVKSTSEFLNYGGNQGGSRWAPQNTAVVLTGLSLASGEAVSPPTSLGQSILVFGDSITEGYRTVNGNGSGTQDTDGADALLGWAYRQRELLGVEVGVIGFAAAGINQAGLLGVPNFPNSYDLLWSGQARTFAPAPDMIVVLYGENDGTSSGDATFIANYTAAISGLLAATPSTTRIACMVPFSQKKSADITTALAQLSNPRVTKIDTAGMFNAADSTDGQHPLGIANLGTIGPAVANKLRPLLMGIRNRWTHA